MHGEAGVCSLNSAWFWRTLDTQPQQLNQGLPEVRQHNPPLPPTPPSPCRIPRSTLALDCPIIQLLPDCLLLALPPAQKSGTKIGWRPPGPALGFLKSFRLATRPYFSPRLLHNISIRPNPSIRSLLPLRRCGLPRERGCKPGRAGGDKHLRSLQASRPSSFLALPRSLSTLQSPDTLDIHGHRRMRCHWAPEILPVLASLTVQHLVPPMARSPVATGL